MRNPGQDQLEKPQLVEMRRLRLRAEITTLVKVSSEDIRGSWGIRDKGQKIEEKVFEGKDKEQASSDSGE